MKKILLLLSVMLVLGFTALALTFTPHTLPVPDNFTIAIPDARPPPGMTLSAIHAGKMFSPAAMAYRGGSFGDERVFSMGGVLVQHPRGMLLFDAGFGSKVDEHFLTTPRLMQLTSRYEKQPTVAEQLKAAGIASDELMGVVLTHAHWDHISGVEELRGVPIWITQPELDFVKSGNQATALARQLDLPDYKTYDFPGGAYLGFDASFDVFGDGSVVIVPAFAHTPGSIIAFINLPSGARYAMVGDLVWQSEGVDLPAEKPWLASRLVDSDRDATRALIVHMHQLQKAVPQLVIVPAHDSRVWEKLPRLPAATPRAD